MTGKELKELRKKWKLSQWKLAIKLGVSQGSITNWEAGYTAIPEDIVKHLEAMGDYDA